MSHSRRPAKRARTARPRLSLELLERRTLLTVDVLTSFGGLNFPDSGDSVPPDTIAASGPDHVVEMINTAIAIFDKNTGVKQFQQSLNAFFADLGPGSNLFDPVVAYDESASRFFVGVLDMDESTETSFFEFAASDTSNPLDGFSERHKIDVKETVGGVSSWADFPRVGWNADAWVFTFNMFAFDGDYDHVQVLAIDKVTALDGLDATFVTHQVDRDNMHTTMAPATMHGSLPGDPMWLVEEAGEANGSMLRVVKMSDVLGITTFTDFDVTVPPYRSPRPAPQPGRGKIDSGDTGVLNAAWREDRLVAAQTVGGLTRKGPAARARWYEFDTSGVAPTLSQSGEINPARRISTYYPSIDIAANGDLGMTYMQSWSRQSMSMYVTGRKLGDPPGTMQTPVLVKSGQAKYRAFDRSPFRAGDYSGITVDPTTGTSFWAANEYATSPPPENWGTWIANFSVAASTSKSAVTLTTISAVESQSAAQLTTSPGRRPTAPSDVVLKNKLHAPSVDWLLTQAHRNEPRLRLAQRRVLRGLDRSVESPLCDLSSGPHRKGSE